MGLNQSSSGTAKNAALINLHLATAQIGKPGAGPFSLTGQPNAMGGREVGGLSNLETILPAASALAKRHVAYGAKAEHYPVVGATLLWTLEKGLGEAWTPDVAAAWSAAYGTLSGFMISKAYDSSQAAE
jgi:anaerobic selenocysteine-containing dehydrogenase